MGVGEDLRVVSARGTAQAPVPCRVARPVGALGSADMGLRGLLDAAVKFHRVDRAGEAVEPTAAQACGLITPLCVSHAAAAPTRLDHARATAGSPRETAELSLARPVRCAPPAPRGSVAGADGALIAMDVAARSGKTWSAAASKRLRSAWTTPSAETPSDVPVRPAQRPYSRGGHQLGAATS